MVLTRRPARERELPWDGRTLGPWTAAVDGADAVINLAGRSVNCRYTPANLREMLDSRVESARVVGEAIAAAARPPRVWLQMSTATIYAHRFDAPNDEATGARLGLGGPVNLTAPAPLPQRAFMRALRTAWGVPVGLPATTWMAEIGALALRSDTELLLKSRRVVPGRLLGAGFAFERPRWPDAAADLVRRVRGR
jgi:NAD dependent epimerase/dehydratase family enzyme